MAKKTRRVEAIHIKPRYGGVKAVLTLDDGTEVRMSRACVAALIDGVTDALEEAELQDAEMEATEAVKH